MAKINDYKILGVDRSGVKARSLCPIPDFYSKATKTSDEDNLKQIPPPKKI
jgi:hypothetical protein